MTQFTSWSALEKAAKRKMQDAMKATVEESYQDAKVNVAAFYTLPGNPTSIANPPPGYDRTGRLGKSPEREFSLGGSSASGEIKLNTDYTYKPSGRDTTTIYNYAEQDGLLGLGGFWEETKQDVKKNINQEFGKRFSK